IAAANPSAPETAATSYIASKLSWFFWLDAAPSSLYGHPTRFIQIDASNPLPDLPREARVSQELWWPLITPAGSDKAAALLPPPGVPVVQPVVAAATLKSGVPAQRPRADGDSADVCAIVIYGSSEYALQNSAAAMYDFMKNDLGVPEGNILRSSDLLT